MQKEEDDEIAAFNELYGDCDAVESGSRQHKSNTPPHTPTDLISEDEDEGDKCEESRNDLEEGREIEMNTTSTQQARIERKQKDFDILSKRLEDNGWKLRLKIFADPLQSNLAISMNASTRTLAEILQLVPLEDAEQISKFQDTVYMPLHFLEKYLLPSMQLRKLLETEYQTSEEEPLPGGPETAILYSLYHQTKMMRSSTQDNKLRSLVTHSDDNTSQLVKDITNNTKAKEMTLDIYQSAEGSDKTPFSADSMPHEGGRRFREEPAD